MPPARTLLPLLCLSLLVSCAPTEPRPGGTGDYSGDLGDDPDFSDAHSRIEVKTWLEYEQTQLQGHFADGPPLRFHEESERSGNCRLMTYTPSNCAPVCGDGTSCVQGECVAWPEREYRGDLQWTWPDGEQTVAPDSLFGYFATGETRTAGDVHIAVDGLELVAPTIGAPVAIGAWNVAMETRGAGDATLRWEDPILDARIRLHMTDCLGSHGGLALNEVECEGPDTGELVVPGAFLDALEAGDWSHGECGSHTFARYHAAADPEDSAVRLETVGDGGLFYFPGQ